MILVFRMDVPVITRAIINDELQAHKIIEGAKELREDEMKSRIAEGVESLLQIPGAIMLEPIARSLDDCGQLSVS